MTDCVVIGGGVVGMFTARELHAAGVSVLLLERGHTGRESSWAGGGILSPLYPWRQPSPVSELVRWSQARYAILAGALRDETRFDPEWTRCGMLVLGAEDYLEAMRWADHSGVAMEIISGEKMLRCEPALAAGYDQGLWLPQVDQIRTPRLNKALRESLLAAGVVVREHCEVKTIRQHQGKVQGVETDSGFIAARTVIVASGAWSATLLAPLGVSIPVRPIRGQMIVIRGRPGELKRILLREGRYVIPRRDGRVLVGSTIEDVGFDKGVTKEACKELYQVALELAPCLAKGVIEHQWAGLRPGSPSSVPFVGISPQIEGLWANTGHFRNGLVLAPASARILVDMLLGRPSFTDTTPFALPNKVEPPLNVV
ncbi:MAG: glycine oxidase ThiO [Gammaproteobacteria bacterium]